MAELNQFQRSMDRINEMLRHLVPKSGDPEIALYIKSLEMALRTLELKMEECRLNLSANKGGTAFDFSF